MHYFRDKASLQRQGHRKKEKERKTKGETEPEI